MSDEGLRAELEEFCADQSSSVVTRGEVRRLLAAHPAEPVPVEPVDARSHLREKYREELDEWWAEQVAQHEAEPVPVADRERAIEVGAQAIHRWDKRPVTWEQLDADTLEQYRSEAAVVVDALLAAGVFRSEPEIQDPVAGRDYMWDSSPVPAQDADDDEEYCPKCFAGMTAANHDECTDVRLVAARARVTAVLRAQRVMVTDEWHLTETSAGRVADALAAAGVFRSEVAAKCSECGHTHTENGCIGEQTPSDRWAGVFPSTCDCDTAPHSEAVALDREAALNAMIAAIYEPEDGNIGIVRQGLPQHDWEVLSIAADAVMQLARPEAVVKAEALREAADAYAPGSHDWHKFRQWLRERADEMEEK